MTSKTLSRRPVSSQPNGALALAWGKHTHQGPRAENQDAVIVVGPRDPQIVRKGVLMIVCDGVGGAQGGRRASEIASTTAFQAYYADASPDPRVSIDNAIRKANAAVKDEAARNPAIASMATTIVVSVVVGNTLYVGHVGDSRAYLFRADGRNERITRDHSWVHEQVERGVLTEEQAKENPMRSVITRSLGAAANNTSEQRQFTLGPGDALLVCTDGLHGVVSDDQMRAILKRTPHPQRAAEVLVETGLANKTTDNTTAAVLTVAAPVRPNKGAPTGLILALGAVALALALAAVLVLGRPSGGSDPGVVATPTSPLIALPTARGTGGTSVLIGGDATKAPTAVLEPGQPTSTLSPDLPTPTPVPTRAPFTPVPATATPLPQTEAPTAAPTSSNQGGGPAPTSPPPAQATSTPPAAQPTATTGAAPTATAAAPTATPIPPEPTVAPKPTDEPKPTKPPPPPKP